MYLERVEKQTTKDAIYTLQGAVQRLIKQIEAKLTISNTTGPQGSLYTAAAQRGATSGEQSCIGHVEPTKPVPA